MRSRKDTNMTNEQTFIITPYKRLINVAISKALMTIINIFGFGAFFSGLVLAWINVDVFTRSVLQLLGCVFMLFKIVQAVDGFFHKRAINKLERRQKELEQIIREEQYQRSHVNI